MKCIIVILFLYRSAYTQAPKWVCCFYYLGVAKCENFAKENFCSLETMFQNQYIVSKFMVAMGNDAAPILWVADAWKQLKAKVLR